MNIIEIKKREFQEARLRKGLTQRALASKAGVTQSTVFSIENKKTTPTPTTVKKICKALEVNFDEIFNIVEKEVD
jgi:DNA-binding XRE family transcriptional regulator